MTISCALFHYEDSTNFWSIKVYYTGFTKTRTRYQAYSIIFLPVYYRFDLSLSRSSE